MTSLQSKTVYHRLESFFTNFFSGFGEYGFRWPFILEILDSRISTVAVRWWFSRWLLINMTHADSFIDCLIKNDLSVCSNCNMFYCVFISLFRQTDLEIFRVTVFPRQRKNENQPFMMHLGIRPVNLVMSADSLRQPLVNLKSMALSKLIFSRKEVWEDHHGRADGWNIHLLNHLYLQERVRKTYLV